MGPRVTSTRNEKISPPAQTACASSALLFLLPLASRCFGITNHGHSFTFIWFYGVLWSIRQRIDVVHIKPSGIFVLIKIKKKTVVHLICACSLFPATDRYHIFLVDAPGSLNAVGTSSRLLS
ncbi:unnamed protein product [Ixodes pacificus]